MRRRASVWVWALAAGLVALLVAASTALVLGGRWTDAGCRGIRAGTSGDPVDWSSVSGLAIGFGYDSLTQNAAYLAEQVAHVDEADPAAVSVSAGRADWATFPWPGHEDDWSQPVAQSGCDLLGRALDGLGTRSDGSRRARIVVVDAFVGGWIERDPSIAGVAADGTRSTVQASVDQLQSGPVGDAIVELVGTVARRYHPEAISLTELFVIDTFGEDDLDSYSRYTGASDWPRTDSGAIDERDASIGAWRSAAIGELVGRARAAAAESGVPLLMEVRVNWSDPTAGRTDSGQDYDVLMAAADQLVSWDYFGLGSGNLEAVEPSVRAREARWPGRWVSSPGLWATGGATVSPTDMATAVSAAFAAGSKVVWVTPASMMTAEHWDALSQLGAAGQ